MDAVSGEPVVAIDPAVEPLIPLTRVPTIAWLPVRRGGTQLAVATVYRWATAGLRGHRLEVLFCGGGTYTSEAALKRFFMRVTEAKTARPEVEHAR